MFDTFMRNTLPVWLAFTILYAFFVAAYVVRATRRLRQLRELRIRTLRLTVKAPEWHEARDWVPSP